MEKNRYLPDYQCWKERDFLADREVSRMSPTQRNLYRALLQAAFNCSTRPYLPADDEQLYLLADAETIETWNEQKVPVLKMFKRFTDEDGEELLERSRLTRDWEQMMASREKKIKAGRARQSGSTNDRSSAGAHQSSADALKLKPENETKLKPKSVKEKINQTETEIAPVSVDYYQVLFNRDEPPSVQEMADTLLELWTAKSGLPGKASDFVAMLELYDEPGEEEFHEIASCLNFVYSTSDYWAERLENARGFRNAYSAIQGQRIKYIKRALASKQKKKDGDEYDSPVYGYNSVPLEEDDSYSAVERDPLDED